MAEAIYARIKRALREQIEDGSLRPGDRIPSENQLVTEYTVSRMTARRALLELSEEGLLDRRAGLGTFVADPRPVSSFTQIRDIAEEVQQRGHVHSCRILSLETVAASATHATEMRINKGDSLFHSVMVHLENDRPLQWESRFVATQLAPEYLSQDFSKLTPSAYLSEIAPLTEADQTVEAILPDAEVAAELHMTPDRPCLKIYRRTFSRRGVISLAELIYPGDRYRLGSHIDN